MFRRTKAVQSIEFLEHLYPTICNCSLKVVFLKRIARSPEDVSCNPIPSVRHIIIIQEKLREDKQSCNGWCHDHLINRSSKVSRGICGNAVDLQYSASLRDHRPITTFIYSDSLIASCKPRKLILNIHSVSSKFESPNNAAQREK
jgi:hypothetical protein